MVQRIVGIQLKPEYRNPEDLDRIIAETLEVLPQAHGVLEITAGVPGDSRTRSEWDLCLFVTFDTMDDVEAYRTDKVHRAYADEFLKPLRKKIRVWNFELAP